MVTTIKDGSFAFACPSSLRENYAYPSYTIVVDTDDDGRCSEADHAWQAQLYGWNAAVLAETSAETSLESIAPIAARQGPIGGSGSYCQAYFE